MDKYRQPWKKFWLNVWHSFFGHPKKDCIAVGGLSVRCKCGAFISLSDFY
jgi:hypothetical protein